MKKVKYNDIKNLDFKELTKKASLLKKDLFDVKMKHCLGQQTNPLEIRQKRKDMARFYTALNSLKKEKSL